MTKSRSLILWLLLCLPAAAQIQLVAHVKSSGSGTSSAIDTTGSSLLLLTVADSANDPATHTPSDSKGNTWRLAHASVTDGSRYVTLWYAWGALNVGASHTFTFTGGTFASFQVSAYSGVLTTGDPLEQWIDGSTPTNNGTTSTLSLSLTPSADRELIFGGLGLRGTSGPTLAFPASQIDTVEWVSSTRIGTSTGYTVEATAKAATIRWDASNSSSPYAMVAFAAVFKPAPTTEDFTLVFVPDVHLGNGTTGEGAGSVWDKQTDWIVAAKTAYRIQAVFGGGDFTWNTFITDERAAWTYGYSKFDGVLPYITAPGNHDYDADGTNPAGRVTTTFTAQVGAGRPHTGTSYGYNTAAGYEANQWIKFQTNSRRFLILALEFYPRPAAIAWADGILNDADNLGREVIIVTHGYARSGVSAYSAARLVLRSDTYGPDGYSLPATDYAGTDLQSWAATHANVRAVFCGHYIGDTFHHSYRVDTNAAGTPMYSVFTNYQDFHPHEDEYLTLLQFRGGNVTISQLNTQQSALDATIPPYTLAWTPSTLGSNALRFSIP